MLSPHLYHHHHHHTNANANANTNTNANTTNNQTTTTTTTPTTIWDCRHCIKVITRGASNRIAQFAVDYAAKQGRKRVTCLHKANVCKQSDGLFLSEFRKVVSVVIFLRDGTFGA
jgi:isocitrate/isopropylmalate dehydrogenase